MKRLALLVVLGFSLLLAACGGGEKKSREVPEGVPTTTGTTAKDELFGFGNALAPIGDRGPAGAAGAAGAAGPAGAVGSAWQPSLPAQPAAPPARLPAATPAAAPTPTPAPRASSLTASATGVSLLAAADRKVISTASVSLEVPEAQPVIARIRSIVEGLGGFIEQLSTSGEPERQQANLAVRVPQPEFFTALERIQALGKVLGQNVGSSDVSEQFIDLEARLKSALRQEESFLSLLSKAQSVSDVLTIERELARVRAEIERFQGQLNFLQRRVALATISVSLVPPGKEVTPPPAAALVVQVGNVSRALDEIRGLVSTLQGAIDSSVLSIREGEERANIAFRVFSEDFDRALSQVEDKGKVRSKELRQGGQPPDPAKERMGKPNAPIQVSLVQKEKKKNEFPTWALVLSIVLPVVALTLAAGGGYWVRRGRRGQGSTIQRS